MISPEAGKSRSARLIFVNRFFYPDHAATAQMLGDLAFALAEDGEQITVLCSRGSYGGAAGKLPREEEVRGLRVVRLAAPSLTHIGLAGRVIDYLAFYVAAGAWLYRRLRRGDILVAKTDPPMLSIVLVPIARAKGAQLINWLQDLYPEVAIALGVRGLGGRFGKMLRRLRNRSLAAAAVNVVIGRRMERRLLDEGIPAQRLLLIPNWADDRAIRPLRHESGGLRGQWGFGPDDFVVGYSGNFGRAHEAETFASAARLLAEEPHIKFVFVGGGPGMAAVRRLSGQRSQVSFQPYQPRSRLAEALAVPDLHWLSLRREMEGLIVPSKFYGIAAAGRPILAVADPEGELGALIGAHDCGLAVSPGDPLGFADAVRRLAYDRPLAARMGDNARRMLDEGLTFAHALQAWRRVLTGLADHRRS